MAIPIITIHNLWIVMLFSRKILKSYIRQIRSNPRIKVMIYVIFPQKWQFMLKNEIFEFSRNLPLKIFRQKISYAGRSSSMIELGWPAYELVSLFRPYFVLITRSFVSFSSHPYLKKRPGPSQRQIGTRTVLRRSVPSSDPWLEPKLNSIFHITCHLSKIRSNLGGFHLVGVF